MATIIDLKDLEVDTLSDETMNLISRLTAEIRKVNGESFAFNDPMLLPRIRTCVKKLRNPKINAIYNQYQQELVRSVNSGHFEIRGNHAMHMNNGVFYETNVMSA
ncbi:MAG: hypothetical protein KJP04_05140 [Arenicella sp.]|nr:hypothetical protein [Arenicella sp.]